MLEYSFIYFLKHILFTTNFSETIKHNKPNLEVKLHKFQTTYKVGIHSAITHITFHRSSYKGLDMNAEYTHGLSSYITHTKINILFVLFNVAYSQENNLNILYLALK